MDTDAVPFPRPASQHLPKIGWYGLGAMGSFMARNLAASNRLESPVLVYNRTVSKAGKFVNDIGTNTVTVASSLAQLVTECDVIFTNLANDTAVQCAYDDFAKIMTVSHDAKCFVELACILGLYQQTPSDGRKIFVDTSTVGVTARKCNIH